MLAVNTHSFLRIDASHVDFNWFEFTPVDGGSAGNSAPVAADDTATTLIDEQVTIAVLANDSDVDAGDVLTIQSTANELGGTTAIVGNEIVFTPSTSFEGDASFTYTIIDTAGATASAEVVISVEASSPTPSPSPSPTPIPDPSPTPDAARITEGVVIEYDFAENAGDVVNDISGFGSAMNLSIPDESKVEWLACGGLRVTQSTQLSVIGSSIKLYDALTATDELTVEAWVSPANIVQSGPARIITYSEASWGANFVLGQESGAFAQRLRNSADNWAGDANTLLSASSTAVANQLTHVVYARAADGSARMYIDGVLSNEGQVNGSMVLMNHYNFALANEFGADHGWLGDLRHVAIYNRALSAEEIDTNFVAGVVSTCASSNNAPVANPNNETVVQDSVANVFDVLANDTDADGDSLVITSVEQPGAGTTSTDGLTILYTPNAGFTGSDSFTYYIEDSQGAPSSATVNVSVTQYSGSRPSVTPSVTYSTSGSYEIHWGRGEVDGLEPSHTWIYENGSPILVYGYRNATNHDIQPLLRAKTYSGSWTYYTRSCVNVEILQSTLNVDNAICENSDPVTVTVDLSGTSTGSTVRVEAENYFNTNDVVQPWQTNPAPTTDVEGGEKLTITAAGEWFEYSVFLSAGTYDITARVASVVSDSAFSVELDGALVGNSQTGYTNNWQTLTWATKDVGQVTVAGGEYTFTLLIDGSHVDFNWFEFTPSGGSQAPLDSDGDGVIDAADQCPSTPENSNVDEFGCPVQEVVTGIDTPPEPNSAANIVTPSEIAAGDQLTTIGGVFEVDASGAATYTVPISVPEGTAGVSPQLSLAYSSIVPNGIAGKGWNIGGLSAITRCRQTAFQDNNPQPITWTDADRFCFDGQRLLVQGSGVYGAPNTSYKTEIDTQVIVTARGGSNGHPDYFEVTAKDGSTTIYGGSGLSDSEVAPYDDQDEKIDSRISSWNVSEYRDSVGNQIVYVYNNSVDGTTLSEVLYAYGSDTEPSAKVVFKYENRDDVLNGFLAGYEFKNTQRLYEVEVQNKVEASGSLQSLRQYKLNYVADAAYYYQAEISRLESIQLCAQNTCYDDVRTTFTWGDIVPPGEGGESSTADLASTRDFLVDYRTPDINGDGQLDLVMLEGTSSGDIDKTTGDLVNISYHLYLTYKLAGSDSVIPIADYETNSLSSSSDITVLDYNADGRSDIFFRGTIYVSELQSDGTWQLDTTGDSTPWLPSQKQTFADINGDGLLDRIWLASNGVLSVNFLERDPDELPTSDRYYHFGDATSLVLERDANAGDWVFNSNNYTTGDFNGDGQLDIVVEVRRLYHENNPDGNIPCSFVGCEDVYETARIVFVRDGLNNRFVQLNPAVYSGYFDPGYSHTIHTHKSTYSFLPSLDLNSDGLADLIYGLESGEPYYALSTGAGFLDSVLITNELEDDERGFWLDFNYDGYLDYGWHNKYSPSQIRFLPWNPKTKTYDSSEYLRGAGPSEGHFYAIYDENGDGWLDFIVFDGPDSELRTFLTDGDANDRADLIHQIRNSLGNETDITYKSLVHSGHYTSVQGANGSSANEPICVVHTTYGGITYQSCRREDIYTQNIDDFYSQLNAPFANLPQGHFTLSPEQHAPVLELAGSSFVVTEAHSSMPTMTDANAKVAVAYYYHQLRAQMAGSGSLGFKKITKVDLQNDIKTSTTFRQDWPFVGQPIETTTESADGAILSRSEITPAIFGISSDAEIEAAKDALLLGGSSALGALQIFNGETKEYSYELEENGALQGEVLSTAVSTIVPDEYGNLLSSATSVYQGEGETNLFSQMTTENTYYNSEEGRSLGRMMSSTVTTHRPSATVPTVSKTAEFSYFGFDNEGNCGFSVELRGLLCSESIVIGAQKQMTTRHYYDDFGNGIFTQATDEISGETRLSALQEYDASGRYVNNVYNIFAAGAQGAEQSVAEEYANLLDSQSVVRLVSSVTSRDVSGIATRVKSLYRNKFR